MRKLLVIAFILLLGIGVGGKAWALSYSGYITGGDGLYGTEGWSDAMLSWTVDDNAGYWTYDYTFTVDEKGISHFIFEVSTAFTLDNIKFGTTLGYELNTHSPGNSNPDMPAPVYGLKWETTGDDVLSFSVIIVSDREPMWGDFYAKDGKVDQGQLEIYAYNTGFGTDTGALVGDGNAEGWVLVPDTLSVPEPATLLLLGSGFLGLALLSRKRFRTRG